MPVRNFTWNDLPALLELVGRVRGGESQDQELQQNFREFLSQPGLAPEENCLLLEEFGQLEGFCLVSPELPIGRAVLELETAPELAGSPSERQVVHCAVTRAGEMGARVAHLCLPQCSPRRTLLEEEGFSQIRTYWEMVWRQEMVPWTPLPDGFSIRHFQPGDAAALAGVQNASFAGSWGFCPNTVEQIEYRTSMTNTSRQGILFIDHGERVAGYCWTSIAPVDGKTRGIICMMGVVPVYRGRGVSRSILLAGMEYLRSIGVDGIGLNVDGSNAPAIRLYTSVGFEKVRELHWFRVNAQASQPHR